LGWGGLVRPELSGDNRTLSPYRARRTADEFGQVLVGQADVDRVAVCAALPLEADQVPQRGGHAGPDRRDELPVQSTLEELCAGGRRLQ